MKIYEKIAKQLELEPLTREGGMFKRTYSSPGLVNNEHMGSAIYYLLSGQAFSHLHVLPTDEVYHFYSGDPVILVELYEDGTAKKTILGQDILAGQHVQYVVKAGVWQGSYLAENSEYALLGTTMSPGFKDTDYVSADQAELIEKFPEMETEIVRLTGDIKYT